MEATIVMPNFHRSTTRDYFKSWYREVRLSRKYRKEILSWDWEGLVLAAEAQEAVEDIYGDSRYKLVYIGSVMSLSPSGKYYMPWCSNFTEEEAEKDSLFFEALEAVASDNGGWIENGEDDPTDVFFCISLDEEEE